MRTIEDFIKKYQIVLTEEMLEDLRELSSQLALQRKTTSVAEAVKSYRNGYADGACGLGFQK